MPLVRREDALLFIIDIQERLVPAMHAAESLIERCTKLIDIAVALGLPIVATEQYRKGLGATLPVLAERLARAPVFDKTSFSAMADGPTREALRRSGRGTLIIAGIEAHVCVLQTAIEAVEEGFEVFVVADATTSRRPLDHETALARLRRSGATVTTLESVAFECMRKAATREFKTVSRLIR